MNILQIILLIFFVGSCSFGNDGTANKQDSVSSTYSGPESDSIAIKSFEVKSLTFEEINQILYDNLINGEFGPHAVENDSGYYVLSVEPYIDRLREHGIFSEEFYEHERERVKQCKEDLEKLRYRGDADLGWAPNSCFFDFMYWLKSQEHPDGFEMKNLELMDTEAKSNMAFYLEYDGEKHYEKGLEIHYRKESGNWKVSLILRLDD